MERYGVDNAAKLEEIKIKAKQTCIIRYGSISPMGSMKIREKMRQKVIETNLTGIPAKKAKQTNLQKYNCERASQNIIIKNKISKSNKKIAATGIPAIKRKQTCMERYGVEHVLQNPKILKKVEDTKKNKNSFMSSNLEEQAYQLLLTKFDKDNIIRQYKSLVYPFRCDFYIKSLDLYIEYQGSHYHYKEPFDKNNPKHIERLKKLIIKNNNKSSKSHKSQYEKMIKVWIIEDPLKREIAQKNNIKYIEFYNIYELEKWLSLNNYI